jgi:hypothetical protein
MCEAWRELSFADGETEAKEYRTPVSLAEN